MLSKREKHLQNLMDEQDAIARKNISTNKNGEWNRFFERLWGVEEVEAMYAVGRLCA
jgi:hypothetical protein